MRKASIVPVSWVFSSWSFRALIVRQYRVERGRSACSSWYSGRWWTGALDGWWEACDHSHLVHLETRGKNRIVDYIAVYNTLLKPKHHSPRCHGFVVHALPLRIHVHQCCMRRPWPERTTCPGRCARAPSWTELAGRAADSPSVRYHADVHAWCFGDEFG